MIPRSADWKNALAAAVRDPAELVALLGLSRELLPAARRAAERFPLRVPRGYVARMRPGDPNDPLLRQVLPVEAEMAAAAGYSEDPLEEAAASAAPGVLHKYDGRVLLVATGACAVHCRYCFRRHFPYGEDNPAADDWQAALDYLHTRSDVHEVILSGGDPLLLDDRRLADLVERLAAVPHLRRLRIHSRLPVLLPERVDEALLAWLAATPLQVVWVVHSNHPNELDAAVGQALGRVRQTGATLLNQAVLLRGVNDDAPTQRALSERLLDHGVLPYYLHLLDRVRGAAHFEVPEAEAVALRERLRQELPGYMVPRLVREQPGEPGKTEVAGDSAWAHPATHI
ncbi:MAG TPA: EF-P beta-lysylation protein EpmB [Gammaproteobacteria bacterium]|nr:EF-P beta-lysylation protein EpmB [Gammaproteobacteria bacterium]